MCWSGGTAPPILTPLNGSVECLQSRSWRIGEKSWHLYRFLCCLRILDIIPAFNIFLDFMRLVEPTANEINDIGLRTIIVFIYLFIFLWRCGPPRTIASLFLRFLDHTQWRITVGRAPLDEWSDLYLTTHNNKHRQTSKPPAGFEPTVSAGELP